MEELKSQIEEFGGSIKELSQNAAQDKRGRKYERTGKKHKGWIHKTQYLSNWCSRKQKQNGEKAIFKEILAKNIPELRIA